MPGLGVFLALGSGIARPECAWPRLAHLPKLSVFSVFSWHLRVDPRWFPDATTAPRQSAECCLCGVPATSRTLHFGWSGAVSPKSGICGTSPGQLLPEAKTRFSSSVWSSGAKKTRFSLSVTRPESETLVHEVFGVPETKTYFYRASSLAPGPKTAHLFIRGRRRGSNPNPKQVTSLGCVCGLLHLQTGSLPSPCKKGSAAA